MKITRDATKLQIEKHLYIFFAKNVAESMTFGRNIIKFALRIRAVNCHDHVVRIIMISYCINNNGELNTQNTVTMITMQISIFRNLKLTLH